MSDPKCYFLDTNIFLDFFINRASPQNNDCHALFKLLQKNKIKTYTSSLILAEIVWTASSFYKIPRKETASMLEYILSSRVTIHDKTDPLRSLALYQKTNAKYIDTQIASIPNVRSGLWIVISYDKDFDKLGIVRKEPHDIISPP